MPTELKDITLHKWGEEPSEKELEIKKENLDDADLEGKNIFRDFRSEAEKSIGYVQNVRITDEELLTDVVVADELIDKYVEKPEETMLTLAPAFSGEVVENEDGDTFLLKDVRMNCVGLILGEHEVRELTNNLGDKLNG